MGRRKQKNYNPEVHADIIKDFDCEIVRITVEEVTPFLFIATEWKKEECLEADRKVYSFETFGGACDKAFNILSEWASAFFQVNADNSQDNSLQTQG